MDCPLQGSTQYHVQPAKRMVEKHRYKNIGRRQSDTYPAQKTDLVSSQQEADVQIQRGNNAYIQRRDNINMQKKENVQMEKADTPYIPKEVLLTQERHSCNREGNVPIGKGSHIHKQRAPLLKVRSLDEKTTRSSAGSTPAKRPTDLPVIPHIITDECKYLCVQPRVHRWRR